MSYNYETGDTFDSGSDYVSEEGHYHFGICEVEIPVKKDGVVDNTKICCIKARVLAGRPEGQEDKLISIYFNAPSPAAKDGGKFAREKFDRFLYAIGLVSPEDKHKKLELTSKSINGRQFVAKIAAEEYQGRTYYKTPGKTFYHVDDREAAWVPKDEEWLRLLDPAWRRIGKEPAKPEPEQTTDVTQVQL